MSRRRQEDRRSARTATAAGRLSRTAARQMAWFALAAALIALLLGCTARCWAWESDYAGTWDPRVLAREVSRRVLIVEDGEVRRLVYEMAMDGRAPRQVDAGPFVTLAGAALVTFALLAWPLRCAFRAAFAARVRAELRPFDELAAKAQQVSELEKRLRSEPHRPPAALHELESAIGRLSPTAPGARLQTGTRELAGLEQAINDLLRRTHEAYRQQSRFVSDASHELRTPIAVVKGYADMLERWGKDDRKVLDEGIAAIRTETAHMSRLVEQLLFLARGDSGRMSLTLAPVELGALVREVAEESAMIHPACRWRCETGEAVWVQADAALLKQAVRILTDNAVKYAAPEPGEAPSIRLRAGRDEAGVPCIEVQDAGVGIAAEDMPHVFERFFRADPARSTREGSGLGLAIAKWIVDRHGGHFDVFSRRGVGTRVTICLPGSGIAPPAEEAPQPEHGAEGHA